MKIRLRETTEEDVKIIDVRRMIKYRDHAVRNATKYRENWPRGTRRDIKKIHQGTRDVSR